MKRLITKTIKSQKGIGDKKECLEDFSKKDRPNEHLIAVHDANRAVISEEEMSAEGAVPGLCTVSNEQRRRQGGADLYHYIARKVLKKRVRWQGMRKKERGDEKTKENEDKAGVVKGSDANCESLTRREKD
eukprot:432058-Ditylum_brightwellii.AAC.1